MSHKDLVNSRTATVPTTGRDLESFRQKHRLQVQQAADLLGIPRTRFKKLSAQAGPIDDPTIGLLIRLYNAFTDQIPNRPDMIQTLYERLGGDSFMSKQDFALCLGRSKSSVPRWFGDGGSQKSHASGPVLKLVQLLFGLPRPAEAIIEASRQESLSRGIDLYTDGAWSKREKPAKPEGEKQRKPRAIKGKGEK